ncbi:hypothetical protein AMTRI_Chr05g61910 [Amborella trichopoda]
MRPSHGLLSHPPSSSSLLDAPFSLLSISWLQHHPSSLTVAPTIKQPPSLPNSPPPLFFPSLVSSIPAISLLFSLSRPLISHHHFATLIFFSLNSQPASSHSHHLAVTINHHATVTVPSSSHHSIATTLLLQHQPITPLFPLCHPSSKPGPSPPLHFPPPPLMSTSLTTSLLCNHQLFPKPLLPFTAATIFHTSPPISSSHLRLSFYFT